MRSDPNKEDAVIVGGMGIWASSSWTHDFVNGGGLAKVDILDLHNYPVTADPESYEPDMAELARMMKERGEVTAHVAYRVWLLRGR